MQTIPHHPSLWSPLFRVIQRQPHRETVEVHRGQELIAYGIPGRAWHIVGLGTYEVR